MGFIMARVRDKLQKRLDSAEDPQARIQEAAASIRRGRTRDVKLIKSGTGKAATIAVTSTKIDLSAPENPDYGEPLGISVVGGAGTVIRGPLALTATPGEVRVAGMWKLNNLLLSAAPSTILTPIPVLRFSLPLEEIARYSKNALAIAALTGIL